MNETNNNNNNDNSNKSKEMSSEIIEFIEACNLLNDNNNLNRVRGEKYLLSLSNRSSPYSFCLSILEICDEAHIQFHALRIICDAFLNEWYNLSLNYVCNLRSKLLLFAINYNKNGKLSGYVLNEISKCISIMYKRKWMIDNDKFNIDNICNHIIIDIDKLLSSNDPSITVIGLTFINELIEEFSVNHASSALGLTWDFHIKCHRGFEQFCLQNLFIKICKLFKKILNDMIIINNGGYIINRKSKILSALQISAASSGSIMVRSVFEMINMTAMCIEKCLSFNFHEKTSDDKLLLAFARNVLINNNGSDQLLRPGPSWKNCLIKSNLLKLLSIFHNLLYIQCNKNKQFNSTIRILRESIINMYSLSGHIFDTPLNIHDNDDNDDDNDDNDDKIDIDDDDDDDDDDEYNHNKNRRITFKLDPKTTRNRRLKGIELVLNRIPYLKECIIYFNKYIWSLIDINNSNNKLDDELIMDICRMFQTLCNNFRYELLTSIHEFGGNEYYFFQGIRDFGNLLISNIPSDINNIDTWSNEGFDILIQSIVSIISCYEIRKHNLKKQSLSILQIFSNMTQQIFIKFIEKMLENAEIEIKSNYNDNNNNDYNEEGGTSQFNDASYLNERLLGIAMIARINGYDSLSYLSSKIQSIISEIKKFKLNLIEYMKTNNNNNNNNNNSIKQIPKQQYINLSIMHEKLFWLFQFLGYTLADDPTREQAKIPNILISNTSNRNKSNNNNKNDDILVSSIYPLFEWIEFENSIINEYIDNNNDILIKLISPLLATIVIKMLCRWSNSYLMPNVAYYEHISLGLLKSFGSEGTTAIATLDMIIYKCYINIFKWSMEREVVYETCLMLESFIKHSSIRPYLFKCKSYQIYILNKYYLNELNLYKLPNNLISIFIRCILYSVIAGQENINNKLSQFNKITLPIYNEFIKNCQPFANQQRLFYNTEQFANLELSIYKLYGIAMTSTHFTFDFMLKKQIFIILIKIIPKFSNNFDNKIVLIIFKIFADIAENSLIDLDKNQSKIFLKLCVNLISQFEKHNILRIKQISHKFIDNKTRSKYEEMQIEEIEIILKLLEFMSTKDLIDINLSTEINDTSLICGQCIFKSFYYLTPHITSTLLQYKSLCLRFYEVLSICIRGFTSTFATKLNNEQRNTILGNKILTSLSCGQYQIIEYGLEIIQCFAEYHLETDNNSPFIIYLQESIHKLFMLLIDIKTPKLLYPKLCETLLPVLISCGKEKIFQYLSQFINNICKNGQKQQQKLADKFTMLINKINQCQKIPLDIQTKAEFRDYFIKLTHEIRSIVTIH